jgi:hypothetical protein
MPILRRLQDVFQRAKNDIANPYTPRNGKFSVAQQIGMLRDPKMLSGERPVPGTSEVEKDAWKSSQLRRKQK